MHWTKTECFLIEEFFALTQTVCDTRLTALATVLWFLLMNKNSKAGLNFVLRIPVS